LSGGDLVFFKYANGVNTQNPINHVGMALNGSTMIHAANPKRGTVVSGIDWANYVGAARPIGMDGKKNFARGGIAMMGKAGEFVVNDSAVQHYGVGFMNALNNQTYHNGGLITENGPQRGAGSGGASYSFVINGVGCDPEEVAEKVMKKIEKTQRRRTSGR
jgi:cell wall-associated NlpC family hydrolase